MGKNGRQQYVRPEIGLGDPVAGRADLLMAAEELSIARTGEKKFEQGLLCRDIALAVNLLQLMKLRDAMRSFLAQTDGTTDFRVVERRIDVERKLRVLEQSIIETVREFLEELIAVASDTRALVGLKRRYVSPDTTPDMHEFLSLLREARVSAFGEAFNLRGGARNVR